MPVGSGSGATVAVSGYASLDHAVATGPFLGTAGTTLVRARLSDPWPGAGGVAHLALALATAGMRVEAVSWVGDDAGGAAWTGALRRAGVGVGVGIGVGASVGS